MKQVIDLAVLSLATVAATPASSAGLGATRSTAKAVEPFAQCFTAAQDSASRPWWFVPKDSGGGTFSNAGAVGVRQPYFLEVADRGTTREIRLTASSTDRSVLRAVDSCI